MVKFGAVTRYDEPRLARLGIPTPSDDFPAVLVHRQTLREIYQHAADELDHEVGGYLLGVPLIEIGTRARITYIDQAVKGNYISSRTRVTLHADSFLDVEIQRLKSGTILVGYYHSHPGLGIFQSGTDIHNFTSYHPELYQIAIVADPTLGASDRLESNLDWIGFFAWDTKHRSRRIQSSNVHVIHSRPGEITTDKGEVIEVRIAPYDGNNDE